VETDHLDRSTIKETNRIGWNKAAHYFYGGTALPIYGPLAPTEDDLRLLDAINGKRILEVGCGSGHSLLYLSEHKAAELWGLDLSETQIDVYREGTQALSEDEKLDGQQRVATVSPRRTSVSTP
jgi:SAM-dependent methyltransferase